jgi:hypothetical protein
VREIHRIDESEHRDRDQRDGDENRDMHGAGEAQQGCGGATTDTAPLLMIQLYAECLAFCRSASCAGIVTGHLDERAGAGS